MKKKPSEIAYRIDMEYRTLRKKYCYNCKNKNNCNILPSECRKQFLKQRIIVEDNK